jgi:hypothetical protein
VAIALGVVLLGLLAAFAIGLPKASPAEDSKGSQSVDLTLPDTLRGGYAAADDAASFKGGQLAQQADAIAEQQQASTTYGNKVLPEVLGTSAATRSYVVDGTKAVFVQAFQSTGGAFAPSTLTDPSTSNGAGGTTMESVGDGACILSYAPTQGGAQPSTAPSSSQCQVTRDTLTVQIQSSEVPAKDLVTVADSLLDQLQDR